MMGSVSTGNITTVGSQDFAMKLGSKLNVLRKRKESFHVIDEKIRDLCDNCKKEGDDVKKDDNNDEDDKVNATIQSEEDNNVHDKKIEDIEQEKIIIVKNGEKNVVNISNEEIDPTYKANSMSSIEEILDGKLSSSPSGSMRSTKTMTPQEKVRLWLPLLYMELGKKAEHRN